MNYELFNSLWWAIAGALTYRFGGWSSVIGGALGIVVYHLVLKPMFGI